MVSQCAECVEMLCVLGCSGCCGVISGGFKYFDFSPLPREMIQFDKHIIFFKWVETTISLGWIFEIVSLQQRLVVLADSSRGLFHCQQNFLG